LTDDLDAQTSMLAGSDEREKLAQRAERRSNEDMNAR
jgi:hypothetical protein